MGVYINMEMPTEESIGIFLYPDGRVHVWRPNAMVGQEYKAVHVPPHGDLIDRNVLYAKTAEWEAQALHMCEATMHDDTSEWRKWSTVLTERSAFKYDVADAPTIIPADPAEEVEK